MASSRTLLYKLYFFLSLHPQYSNNYLGVRFNEYQCARTIAKIPKPLIDPSVALKTGQREIICGRNVMKLLWSTPPESGLGSYQRRLHGDDVCCRIQTVMMTDYHLDAQDDRSEHFECSEA